MQKIKAFLVFLPILLMGCHEKNDTPFLGEWGFVTKENLSAQLNIRKDGSFIFKNMPMKIMCREDTSYISTLSGDWSINSENRIDFSISNIKSRSCKIPPSFLINGFYDGAFFTSEKITFFLNGPDDPKGKVVYTRQ